MIARRFLEFAVGLFMILGVVALVVLAFKASSFSQYSQRNSYQVTAVFDHIGDLKIRAPVTIAGVRVGEVKKIMIDPVTFRAKVVMFLDKKQQNLPSDSSASILTAGLIGANYIEIAPGFADNLLKNDGLIEETHPAVILERLIGQLVYNLKGDKEKDENKKTK